MDNEDINKRPPFKNGIYFDDGTPYNPDLHPMPNLCVICKKKDNPNEKLLCDLNRMDQSGEDDFKCGAYEALD